MSQLEHRLSESQEALTANERLFRDWQAAKQMKRQAENLEKALRPEVDALMASGELVGDSTAWLAIDTVTKYEVDQEKARQTLGEEVWARCAEVTGAKLKDALKIGLVTQKEFDALTTEKVEKRLVTKTQPKA